MESFFSKYGTIKTRKSLFQKGYEKLRNVMYHKSRFSEYRQSSDANLGTMQKRIKNRPHVLQKDSSMICKSFSGIVAVFFFTSNNGKQRQTSNSRKEININ
ncbi:hypothetical protein RIR_jg33083.t1 [Rhizophagus irregularis DAOM 181602=DAOM 197198]|nr:hypothetical protein RIR_jg33083.t1 [Rhizophagus irregularis DAOM 181602=DAOM 197198]